MTPTVDTGQHCERLPHLVVQRLLISCVTMASASLRVSSDSLVTGPITRTANRVPGTGASL